MTPESSFLAKFTIDGRLRNQWQQALAETDIQKRLIGFRQVLHQLQMSPAKFAHMWPSFLDAFLEDNHVRYLSEADLQLVVNVGVVLSSTSTDTSTNLPEDIWKRVLHAFIMREDTQKAHSLMMYMYGSPFVRWEYKEWIVHKLARLGARYAEDLKIYIHYLHHAPEPTQTADVQYVLEDVCSVGFHSNTAELRLAKETASPLVESQFRVKGVYNALAFYWLLIEKKPANAIVWFNHALEQSPRDISAIRGLLVAAIQCEDYTYVSKVAGLTEQCTDESIAALLKIGMVLQWLNNSYAGGIPPHTVETIESFKSLNIHFYIGDIFDVAVGKLYLLDGNAKKASEILRPVVSRHPEQPQLHYYSAWADVLLNDHDHLASSFVSLSKWPERWMIAALLLDTNPTVLEKDHARICLEESAKSKQHLAPVINARIALAQGNAPKGFFWKVQMDASMEENMEALRTAIGYAIYVKDTKLLGQFTALPLFQHLPLPEKSLWCGLLLIMTGNMGSGRSCLENAVIKHGYKRAVLILAVHYLEQDMLPQAKCYLERASSLCTDVKTAVLWSYIQNKEGQTDQSIETLKNVTAQDNVRVQYALGNLYLHQKQYGDAKEAFDKVTRYGKSSLPKDWNVVIQCAKFVIAPGSVDLWYAVHQLENKHKQTWLLWNAALAHLWFSSPDSIANTGEYIASMLDHTGTMKEAIALEIVKAIAYQCARAKQKEQFDALISVLEQIMQRTNQISVKHVCQLGITIATRRGYSQTNTTSSLHKRHSIAERMKTDLTNGSLALFLASLYLADKDTKGAVALLRKVFPLDCWEQMLCLLLADILDGCPISIDEIFSRYIQTKSDSVIAYNLLKILMKFLTGHSDEGATMMLASFEKDQENTVAVIKVEGFFPYICSAALQRKTNFPQEIYRALQSSNETRETVTLVRYMAATAKLDEAYRLWKRVLVERLEPGDVLAQEFAQLLCHMGANSINENYFAAKQKLHEAVYWFGATEQGKLCDNVVEYLELRVAVSNLLRSVFPGIGRLGAIHKRYTWLDDMVQPEPQLRKILLQNDHRSMRLAWKRVVNTESQHIWFLHLLAVLYKDYVFLRNKQATEGDWVRYTALWTLLISSKDFWQYFSKERSTQEQGKREDLDEIQQESLFHDVLDDIFSVHSTRVGQAFGENNYIEAKIHLHCLDICQRGDMALIAALEEQKLTYAFPIDISRIGWVQQKASKIIKTYTDALVKQAEKSLKDADTIKNLLVSKNYEGGIRILEPFIDMNIPVLRVLTICLQWYNDWLNDLVSIKEYSSSQMQILLVAASVIAEKLTPLCTRGEGYKKENQTLASHFSWCGYMAYYRDKVRCIECYREALAWNPANSNAQELLKRLEETKTVTKTATENWHEENDSYEDSYDDEDEEEGDEENWFEPDEHEENSWSS